MKFFFFRFFIYFVVTIFFLIIFIIGVIFTNLKGSSDSTSLNSTDFALYTNKDTLISFSDQAVISFVLNPRALHHINIDSAKYIGDAKYVEYYIDNIDTLHYNLSPNSKICKLYDSNPVKTEYVFTPKENGTYNIVLHLKLHQDSCSDDPIYSTDLKTQVVVNVTLWSKMKNIVESNFLTFWSSLVGIVFAATLGFIRRKFKIKES